MNRLPCGVVSSSSVEASKRRQRVHLSGMWRRRPVSGLGLLVGDFEAPSGGRQGCGSLCRECPRQGSRPPHLSFRGRRPQEQGAPSFYPTLRQTVDFSLKFPSGLSWSRPAAASVRGGSTLRLGARARRLGPAPPAAKPGPGGAAARASVCPRRAPGREPLPKGF